MNTIQGWLGHLSATNPSFVYLKALALFVGMLFAFSIFRNIVLRRLEIWADKTKSNLDEEIVRIFRDTPSILYILVALYIGIQPINPPKNLELGGKTLLIVLLFYWATKVASHLIEYLLRIQAKRRGRKDWERNTAYYSLALFSKILLWIMGTLLIFSNLGINISALSASLGIGGIAIALASQHILGDLFSSFSIYFDRPFEIGDFIVTGGHAGTVKRIGLKTTRIQALQGEEIVISNQELTSTRIQNFKRMDRRRIAFPFGVAYETPNEKLKNIPTLVEAIVKRQKLADLDRAHFKAFGASSLDFEVVYFINSQDYNQYMDCQQAINLGIKEAFEKEGIAFAYPTQTVHIAKVD